jgi:hypothetical protein
MKLFAQLLERRPRKGLATWPLTQHEGSRRAPWLVYCNLHQQAVTHYYLTGAVFHQRNAHGHDKYKLMLVGRCPFHLKRRVLRYYPIQLTEAEAQELKCKK